MKKAIASAVVIAGLLMVASPLLAHHGRGATYDMKKDRRIDADAIEGQLTIYDPKNFTAPWTHPKSTFKRMAPKDVTFFGWKGLFSGVTDAICAPLNEIDEFNKRIRDPAIFGVTK
jgi:hypothetical protein